MKVRVRLRRETTGGYYWREVQGERVGKYFAITRSQGSDALYWDWTLTHIGTGWSSARSNSQQKLREAGARLARLLGPRLYSVRAVDLRRDLPLKLRAKARAIALEAR